MALIKKYNHMSIPTNITKENILKAIEIISSEKIPVKRLSKEYFLKYDDKILPPKYVLSIANKYANKEELDSNLFNAVEAKNFLIKMGFNIETIDSHKSMIFWVEKTIVKGRPDRENGDRALGKAMWSPRKDQRGADIYKNMRLVNAGDIVIHLINNKQISGISIVKRSAIETDGVSGTDWDGESYLIELKDYITLDNPIDRQALLNSQNKRMLEEISSNSEVFYNNKLDLRQGAYLTPCPNKLAALINEVYKNQNSRTLPHFENAKFETMSLMENIPFEASAFKNKLEASGLLFQEKTITRFISSLITKPFVILSGLSGSGKTKLAQAFAQWICQDDSQYCIVPVGADWTNREPLLGYVNALDNAEYVLPENRALELLIVANKEKNANKPYFLILDEMNLSLVERYFADFLSVMESEDKFKLHTDKENEKSGVPYELGWPKNLFVVGTVNIDETTYMFSPKVLDRANTIEFRVNETEIKEFLDTPNEIDLAQLESKGANMGTSFIEIAKNKEFDTIDTDSLNKTLVNFFSELKKTGAEFGYRTGVEIHRLYLQLSVISPDIFENDKIDIAVMQKLLPKLHGSRRKLCPVLEILAKLCIKEGDAKKEYLENEEVIVLKEDTNVIYPLSLEKITRMYKGAIDNGFASYAEA